MMSRKCIGLDFKDKSIGSVFMEATDLDPIWVS
jgi:hypothetical protein